MCPFPWLLPLLTPFPEAVLPPPGGGKGVRDAIGEFPGGAESDNFALKWGPEWEPSEAQAWLDLFEAAWAHEVETMGFAPPYGAESWKFNVYLGDTGEPAPETWGYAGYYTVDPEGWPMIVMNPEGLALGYAASTGAHEFFHAVQHGTGAYLEDPAAAWYWEATAMWMEGEVYPENPADATFLFGLGLAPQLALWHSEEFREGTLSEYHAYGAFVFPRYISEIVGDWTWIRDSWTDSGSATPQAELGVRIEGEGLDSHTAYAHYAARNALWDYADGEVFAANLDRYRTSFRDDSNFAEVAATFSGQGRVDVPVGPAGGGYQLVRQYTPARGEWRWSFSGDPMPWGVVVVRDAPGGPVYLPMTVAEGEGEVTFETDGGDGSVWIAVSAWTDAPETGAWSVTVEEVQATVVDEDDPVDVACGCGVGGGGWTFGGIGGVLAVMRRRPTPSGAPPSARSR